jgi:RIO-like serine/threonine protein kinase
MERSKSFRAVRSNGTGVITLTLTMHDFPRSQIYRLVQDLHSIGVVHGDLELRNVVRVHGGGFRLIDFEESRNISVWKVRCDT